MLITFIWKLKRVQRILNKKVRPGSKKDVRVQINYIASIKVGVEVFKKINYTVSGTGVSMIVWDNLGDLKPGDEMFLSNLQKLEATIEQMHDAENYTEFLKGATTEQICLAIGQLENAINEIQEKLVPSVEIIELEKMLCKFRNRLVACKNEYARYNFEEDTMAGISVIG